MINNLCFNNLELYLDIFVLIQPRRIEIYCNYLMLFTFELYLGFCDIPDFNRFSRHRAVHSYVSFNFHDGHFRESRISFEQSTVVSVNLSS